MLHWHGRWRTLQSSTIRSTIHSDEDLYVNQFLASELTWKEKGISLKQTTNFPVQQGTLLTVQTERPQERTIFVRFRAGRTRPDR